MMYVAHESDLTQFPEISGWPLSLCDVSLLPQNHFSTIGDSVLLDLMYLHFLNKLMNVAFEQTLSKVR